MKATKSQQFWIDHFKRFNASGLSQSEYCRQHNLNKSTFSSQKSQMIGGSKTEENFSEMMIPVKKGKSSLFTIKMETLEFTFSEIPSAEWIAALIKNLGAVYAGNSSI
jgi:hypothetical protein